MFSLSCVYFADDEIFLFSDRQLLKSLKSIRRRVRETKELVYRGEVPSISKAEKAAKVKDERPVEWIRHEEARYVRMKCFKYS